MLPWQYSGRVTEPGSDRRRYLERRFAEALVQTGRVLDPRDAAVGVLVAGLGTAALATAGTLGIQAVVLACYLLVVGAWQLRRRRRVTAALGQLRLLATPEADAPRPGEIGAGSPWPTRILELEDVPDPATLEAVLRPTGADRQDLRRATRSINRGAVLVFVVAALSMLLGLVGVVVTVLASDGEPQALQLVAIATLAMIPGYLLSRTLAEYSDFARLQQAALADRAEQQLARLGAAEAEADAVPFISGRVVVRDGGGYRSERSAMPVPPDGGRPHPFGRVLPWLLGSVVVLVVIAAAVVELLA